MIPILVYPEALVLALPAALVWWVCCRTRPARWLEAAVLSLLVLAAAGPRTAALRGGSDVVLVLDRSGSMGPERGEQQELVELVARQRASGDRLAVVVVGEQAQVAMAPVAEGSVRLTEQPVGPDGTALAAGLRAASSLIGRGRSGRVVVHSDGEHTGRDPRGAAAGLAYRGIPVDVLSVPRRGEVDAAVVDVGLPELLRLGESFIGAARLISDRRETRSWRVLRGRTEIATGSVELEPGRVAVIDFADRPTSPGLTRYTVELEDVDDARSDNNRARAALRVRPGERVLVMGGTGEPGNLARALRAAGMAVVCVSEGRVGLADLLGCRVAVLEQVPASALGRRGMEELAAWVEHLGGGLVLTGGRRSFGSGGYHRSPVEPVLPVTLELRDEHRKLSLALAMVLDRSGSMAMPVGGGPRTKMDLANAGAVAALELLSPLDDAAVIAVDSSPHLVIPMGALRDQASAAAMIRSIESMGGGIFVEVGLEAGGQQLLRSSKGTRHLVLFADANDAEQPGAFRRLLADFAAAGITVSVIGLGTPADSDAGLLREIAKLGGGRCHFADTAVELPRLFAQETVLVARSAWVDETVRLRPDPRLLAVLGRHDAWEHSWPAVAGYNMIYARPRADTLVHAPGDPPGPAVASWRIGTGRSAAVAVEVDGTESGELLDWSGYVPLVAGITRWCAGTDEADIGSLRSQRLGRSVTTTLELDPARREHWPAAAPDLVLVGAGGEARSLAMLPVEDGVYAATWRLDGSDPVLPSVALAQGDGTSALLGAAQVLPYSPEARPRYGRPPGTAVLENIATLSGGNERSDLLDVFANPPSPGRAVDLAPLLVALALACAVGEVLQRRLRLQPRLRRRSVVAEDAAAPAKRSVGSEPPPHVPASEADPAAPPEGLGGGLHDALRQLRRRR
ncbi:MAG: VWA domain-containing protein [Planctomycetota bacterium]